MLEQQRAEPAPLVRVLHDDGDLGVRDAGEAVVAHDADDLVAQQGDDGRAVVVVDGGEALDVAGGQRPDHREEAVVDGLRRQPGVEVAQPLGVVGGDGAQVHRAAVGQDGVGLPVRGVRAGAGRSRSHCALRRRRTCAWERSRGETAPDDPRALRT